MFGATQLTDQNQPPQAAQPTSQVAQDSSMSMESMTAALKEKTGEEFDKEFVAQMIEHHQGAIDMANLASSRAKHDEIKRLSDMIIQAQTTEISMMKTWYGQWGYRAEDLQADKHAH